MQIQEEQILFYNVHTQPFSNFYSSPFKVFQKEYPTSEHYYQSKKFEGTDMQQTIRKAPTIQKCHNLGQNYSYDFNFQDWNIRRQKVYQEAVRYKFQQNKDLAQKLIETGAKKIINVDQDTYWGMKFDENQNKMKGENKTGQILMKVRQFISKKSQN